jgi:RimJ/RimL family protein N-acetyltransferase
MTENMEVPAYRIETQRLVIRCWRPADAPLLNAAVEASLDHLSPWMPWARGEQDDVEARVQRLRQWRAYFDRDEDYFYGIWNPAEDAVLGATGLHTRRGPGAREIGYWIHVDHINRGLATEAAAALTRVAFEVNGVHRVEIRHDPDNVRSEAVPRKLGFVREATLRQRLPAADGGFRDVVIWSLLAGEYAASPAAGAELAAFDAAARRIL